MFGAVDGVGGIGVCAEGLGEDYFGAVCATDRECVADDVPLAFCSEEE